MSQKYINKFESTAEYEAAELLYPNVSLIEGEGLRYVAEEPAPKDYSKDFFTTIAKSDGTISFNGSSPTYHFSYSVNGGEWIQQAAHNEAVTVTTGDKVRWKGNAVPDGLSIGNFSSTAQFEVEGNVMSLISGDSFDEATTMANSQLSELFNGATRLTSAENLVLPATTLAYMCYSNMFNGCTNLTTAPQELLATTLATSCYIAMFRGCTNLTTAPKLLATTLAEWCYYAMFNGCTSLNSLTCLATDISATDCTQNWLSNVASSGTFTKAASMTNWPSGESGIPSNWTIVDYQA